MRKAKQSGFKKRRAVSAIMSYSEYAAHRRVTYQTVRKWVEQGYVARVSNGRVDVQRSDANLNARAAGGPGMRFEIEAANPRRTGSVACDPGAPFTSAEARRIKANYEALSMRDAYEKAAAAVAPIELVQRAIAEEYGYVRRRLMALGEEIASNFAAMRSPNEAKFVIDAAVNRALAELASGITCDPAGSKYEALRPPEPRGKMTTGKRKREAE